MDPNSNIPSHTDAQQYELDRAQKEFAVLYDISNAMRTTLELNPILHIILTGVTAHTGLGFNRAILFLINSKERCLEPKMAIGPESGEHAQEIWEFISHAKQDLDDLIREDRIPQSTSEASFYKSIQHLRIPLTISNENILAQVYHQGNPLVLTENQMNQLPNDPLFQTLKSHEMIIMPLKAKDKVNGIIVADNSYTKKPIGDHDIRMFTMLANQAGLAIENSNLYEMVRHQSYTDSCTGLWNHGFFQDQLRKEVESYQTHQTPVSLIIFDIDNFKKLNDTYGHHNGDIVLQAIANILKNCSREDDFACRYGGEEFVAILPATSKEQAQSIAERIRREIEQYKFPEFSINPNLQVTISVGVANLPQDAQTKEELISITDKMMYTAKFGGKNQTCVA